MLHYALIQFFLFQIRTDGIFAVYRFAVIGRKAVISSAENYQYRCELSSNHSGASVLSFQTNTIIILTFTVDLLFFLISYLLFSFLIIYSFYLQFFICTCNFAYLSFSLIYFSFRLIYNLWSLCPNNLIPFLFCIARRFIDLRDGSTFTHRSLGPYAGSILYMVYGVAISIGLIANFVRSTPVQVSRQPQVRLEVTILPLFSH